MPPKRRSRLVKEDKYYGEDDSDSDEIPSFTPACKGETKRGRKSRRKVDVEKEDNVPPELADNRAVVIDDLENKEKELKKASLLIRKCYLEADKGYQAEIQKELEEDFLKLLEKPAPTPTMPKNRPPFIMKTKNYELYASRSKIFRTVGNETQTKILGCAPIPCPDALPPMPYWIHIESNIKTEDNLRLSHVPYLKEDQNDEDLCSNLISLFEEGIHGYSDNWKYMNEDLVYRVLRLCLQEYDGELDVLYYAFYQLFPNKYSYRQLPEVFSKLVERFEGVKSVSKDLSALPNYPPDSESDKHTMSSVSCTQCWTHDCVTHGFQPYLRNKYPNGRWKPAFLPLTPKCSKNSIPKTLCSKDCWKSLARSRIFEKLGVKDDNVLSEKALVFFDSAELFRLTEEEGSSFISVFCISEEAQKSFCRHADSGANQLVGDGTLTCKQLYEIVLDFCHRPSGVRLYADREKTKVDPSQMHKQFRTTTWQTGVGKVQNKYRMTPCDHQGICGPTNPDCVCNKNGVCTKFCGCDDNCKMKFPGCRCAPGQCRTKQCQCFYAKWECDPYLCKSCQCDTVSNHENSCRNSGISKGSQKKILILPSQVAGWGAFIMENAEKGDIISEYTGEIISSSEVERRGHIYDQFKTSYIFALNEDDCVDAFKMGNLIRFANHSDSHSNCYSQILIVNGSHRIGIFAKRDLVKGEELLFDYSYNKQHKEEFVANDRFGNKTKPKYVKRDSSESSESSSDSDSKDTEEEKKQQKKGGRRLRKV